MNVSNLDRSMSTWLEKATFTTDNLQGGTNGGILSPAQAKAFLRVAIDATTILPEARNEFSDSPKFEVPRISFANRILRPGAEGTRLADADRQTPATGLVTLSTVLVKGEVPISDEVFEDNIERDSVSDTIMTMVAEATGRDVEELVLKGDTARLGSEDTYLQLLDGVIKLNQSGLGTSQKIDLGAAGAPTTYDGVFAKAISSLPARYRRNYSALRLYVPVAHRDGYQTSLSARGTGLGDQVLVNDLATSLAFRGIKVSEVPILTGDSVINGASVDYDKFAMLINPANIIIGWHRKIKVETFRDPREGATSFVVTARVDVKIANPEAAVLLYNIPTTLN